MARPKKVRDGEAVLTHERIVTTALKLADEEGIGGLSMRRLATELDCGAMTLYHYIADKDALLEALVDAVAGEIEPPPADADWRAAAEHIAKAALEVQLDHPWVIPIWATTWPGPHRFALVEQLLDALAGADLPADIADLGFHALTNHVQGFAQQRLSYQELESKADVTAVRLEELFASNQFPRVAEHVEFHRSQHEAHDEFGFALNLILDGLERQRRT